MRILRNIDTLGFVALSVSFGSLDNGVAITIISTAKYINKH